MKTAFQKAAEEFAQDILHAQFPEPATADSMCKEVDASLIADWLAAEGLGRDFEIILGDVCAQRLTSDQAKTVLCGLAVGNPKAQELVLAALVQQVAMDLAYEINKYVENYCPTDSEMSRTSYPSEVDDPLIADKRHLARESR